VETSVSIEEITAPFLAEPESSAPPWGIVEIFDDELKDLATSVTATTSVSPSEAGPSAPQVTAMPDTSDDWKFVHKLFVELNQEAIRIPGDGALVDLVSDDKEATEDDAGEGDKGVAPGDEEEEGTIAVDEPSEQATVPLSPPPSA